MLRRVVWFFLLITGVVLFLSGVLTSTLISTDRLVLLNVQAMTDRLVITSDS